MDSILRPVENSCALSAIMSAFDIAELGGESVKQYLQNGFCTVLAPNNVPEDRLRQFDLGGISIPGKSILREGYEMREVVHYSDALAVLLTNQKWSTYYIHDPIREGNDFHLDDSPFMRVNNQFLYVHQGHNLPKEKLSRLIEKNILSWHFIMFCTMMPVRSYGQMSDLLFETGCVVTGIYDGESFLIWQRTKLSPFI